MNVAQLRDLVNSLDPSLDQCQIVEFVAGRFQPRVINLDVVHKDRNKLSACEDDEKVVLLW